MARLREALLAPTVPAPTMLTAADLAELCRVDASTVARWARAGTGEFPRPLIVDGKRHLWRTADYVDWVATKAARRAGIPAPVDARTLKRRRHA
jgi:predicted DNA-binding transcriptional regulator AlpA